MTEKQQEKMGSGFRNRSVYQIRSINLCFKREPTQLINEQTYTSSYLNDAMVYGRVPVYLQDSGQRHDSADMRNICAKACIDVWECTGKGQTEKIYLKEQQTKLFY